MATTKQRRQPLGQRVHDWLSEPEGETFRLGKWRFWFVAVAGLQLVNAGLTALIFQSAGNLQNYMGAVLLGVGALVGWIAIGCLHYSDSGDRQLARGVSALDSVTLLFVVAHFAFLMWAYGHLKTIQSAEAKYEQQAERFNAQAREVQDANVKIAEAARAVAQETTKTARLENDRAYQLRKASEAGARIPVVRSAPAAGAAPALSTSAVELERPTKPDKSSAQFLTEWDAWIRAANLGELLLVALTLIFIRNQTAKTNAPHVVSVEEFPRSRPQYRAGAPTPAPAFETTHVSMKNDDTDEQRKSTQEINREGLRRLRECLKLIAFHHGPTHFKVDAKPDAGYLWLRQLKSQHGESQMVASTKASLTILDDAMKMEREAFRERLEKFLRQAGFEI